MYCVRSFVPIDIKSTISENLSAINADAGVSTIIPIGGGSTFNSLAFFVTNALASTKSSTVDIIGNMTFILSNDSEVNIDFICESNKSKLANDNLIPLTPKNGFSSTGRFR